MAPVKRNFFSLKMLENRKKRKKLLYFGKAIALSCSRLKVHNFSKRYMCLRTSGNYTQVEILIGNS